MVTLAATSSLAAPDILKQIPVSKLLEAMTVRLDPVKSADVHLTVAFRFTDTGRVFALEVRRGVAQLHESAPARVDVTLHLTVNDLHRIILHQMNFADEFKTEVIKAEGKTTDVARFFSFFDAPASEPPSLTAR
jgi:alkyl sulfatase BDS1-like metallo-beta-lactamase superfamily hydrolase